MYLADEWWMTLLTIPQSDVYAMYIVNLVNALEQGYVTSSGWLLHIHYLYIHMEVF